jgi:hypothetical protein
MGTRTLDLACRAALLLAGAAHAWGFRHDMNPDGMTYLDMASLFAAGDARPLDNATFSPLYALLLAVAFRLTGAVPASEFAVVHAVNFGCYVLALISFEMLMSAAAPDESVDDGASRRPLPAPLFRGLGYALFAWGTLKLISLSVVTPDMLLAAFFFAAAALTLRCARGRSWPRTLALGVVLGIGYWAKAIFFYLSFVFLFLAFFGPDPRRVRIAHTLVALALFGALAAPVIARISRVHGHFTVGESGRLNLIWWVTRMDNPPGHFVPRSPAEGTPVHPLKVIHDEPRAYAFAGPVPATYALWYDPSWWHAGRTIPFGPGHVLRHVAKTAKEYYHLGLFRDMACLLFGWLVFALTGPLLPSLRDSIMGRWRLLLAGLTSPAMYALVHSEARYVAASMIAVWLALFAASRVPSGEDAVRWTRAVILTAVLYLLAIVVPLTAYALIPAELREAPMLSHRAHLTAAGALEKRGVRPGDAVAVLGHGINSYWARLARVRIVAEVDTYDVPKFWAAPLEKQRAVLDAFKAAGAKAVVAREVPQGAPGWEPLPDTELRVFAL